MDELKVVFAKRKLDKEIGTKMASNLKFAAKNYFQELPGGLEAKKDDAELGENCKDLERASAAAILEETTKAMDGPSGAGGYIVSVSKKGLAGACPQA